MTNKNGSSESEPVDEVRIPVVAEEVEVATRKVGGRTVTVTTSPISERETIAEPVTREEVSVERVPIGEVVEAIPEIREDGDLTVIPVVEERVRVVKELVLTEEIHLRRTRHETIDEQVVERRRTQVEISD